VVDSHVILSRIDKIRECVAKLRKFSSMDQESFRRDQSACDSCERNLQIAIQATIDIGNHVVSDMDLGSPRDYKEIFQLMAINNLISDALCAKLVSMTGLRNVLVHDYLDVDTHLIYQIITTELDDFVVFITAVLKLI